VYFGVFDEMILNNKESFFFRARSRRPPMDNVNALLSFVYSLLTYDCAAALESVGLDSYVGFLHRDKPGRPSLALDLMEELRPVMADRFVLTLINTKTVSAEDFIVSENGSIGITDGCRKRILSAWQEKKKESLTHPFLKEKMSWGLIPHVQALLLARYLRGATEAYPPFLWK
jgi:CRISPR-associated protein Cas1